MKKPAKNADKENKNKYSVEHRKETLECYESTIVDHVIY
jgi:hypothetical protein